MKTKKKVAVIGTVGLPANYGGFETLTQHLVEDLGNDFEMTVYCSSRKYTKAQRSAKFGNAKLCWLPFNANGIQSIVYDSISILHASLYADVLLVLGVSGGFLLPLVRLFSGKKIITSIDGIEWKRNKWNKPARLFLWMAEWMAVRFSHVNIADNESIQDYTAIRYKTRSSIIEYGADHTLMVRPSINDFAKYPFLKMPYAFNVCRIEPENNVEMILSSFAQLPRHTLVMIGNWQNGDYGRQLRQQYSVYNNIHLLDAIYDQRELDVLRGNCLVYLHGHSAGGTNPSLVEAMYLGLPVIAYGVTYNRTTTEGKAVYFSNGQQLKDIILETSVEELRNVGCAMKVIAKRRYTWKVIARKYHYLILRTLTSGDKRNLKAEVEERLDRNVLLHYELGHLDLPSLFYEKR